MTENEHCSCAGWAFGIGMFIVTVIIGLAFQLHTKPKYYIAGYTQGQIDYMNGKVVVQKANEVKYTTTQPIEYLDHF